MTDAGRANPDRDTVLKLAGVSPPQPPAPVVASSGAGDPPTPQPPAMPTPAKRVPTSLDRSQVLDATARVLRERGYDGATIRAIARQLDCAVGSIYRYFPDKRTLLDAVCQRRFDAVAENAELRSSMQVSLQKYIRVASDQPELYRLMFWLASVGKQQMGEAVPDVIRRVIAGWAESLGDQAHAKLLWARLHGLLMLGVPTDQVVTMLDLSGNEPMTTPIAAGHSRPAEATAQPPALALARPVVVEAVTRPAEREDVTLL